MLESIVLSKRATETYAGACPSFPSRLTHLWEVGRITELFGIWLRDCETHELCEAQTNGDQLPPKIRELISELQKAGFTDRGGKGSHRNFVHPKATKPITISGASGDDAKHYQVRAVRRAIEESKL